MQIGRNDPCPCGSGKKYKKCCLERDKAAPEVASQPDDDEVTLDDIEADYAEEDNGTHPYEILSEMDSPRFRDKMPPGQWTPAKMAALGTQEIWQRLAALKCGMTDGQLVKFIYESFENREFSAVHLGYALLDECTLKGDDDEDILLLACCELWKRLCPDAPSSEMIFDRVTEGYRLLEQHERGKACMAWRGAWQMLQSHYQNDTVTLDDADDTCNGLIIHGNWLQDYMMACLVEWEQDTQIARDGVALGEAVLARFGADDPPFWFPFRADLGTLYYVLGDEAKGKAAFEALGHAWTESAGTCVRWADALAVKSPLHVPDRGAAIAMLERAKAGNYPDARDWDIDVRLDGFRKELGGLA